MPSRATRCLVLVALILLPPISRLASQPLPRSPSREGAAWVERTLAQMTLEQKVAQLIVVDVQGGYSSEGDARLQGWLALP